jgi:ATP-dependent 26S proteasome regulatory subunit
MDEYEGISILATNLKQNIDEAFLRRLAFTLEFPFPDEASRRMIWETAWPNNAPRDADIDFGHLARQFRFSGGSIRNTVVAAAFLAARRGSVGMVDLLIAARRESEKMGKAPSRADFGPWWDQTQQRIQDVWLEAKAS